MQTRYSAEAFRRTVDVPRCDRYEIVVEPNLLDSWPVRLAPFVEPHSRLWVVTDQQVWTILGPRVLAAPGAAERVAGVYEMTPGETSKSLDGWLALLDWLAASGVCRRDVVVALGGSMVSDVAGFAAATLMRGIAYANLPTTLLAQVDGAVGGKVAVNTTWAKNYVGSFHHPIAVLVDPSALASLPRAEMSNGLAEVIKSFVISDDAAFPLLEQRIERCLDGELDVLTWVVQRAIAQKMSLVDADPYEKDLYRALNFGHTLGHAIETYYGYRQMRHGFAVAVGMAAATRFGLNRGITEPATAERIFQVISRAELPMSVASDAEQIVARTAPIAAVRDGKLHFVVPRRVGEMVYCDDVEPWELVKAVQR